MAQLVFRDVKKAFGPIYALKGVNFQVTQGECVALVGENGAGKSTLMKILSGVWPAGTYEGEVEFEGEVLQLDSAMAGRNTGISIIHQELCLFPELTVAENLFLTESYPYRGKSSRSLLETVDWAVLFTRAEELFADLHFDVNARAKVGDLSVAQQQLVEIARAFHHEAKLLILDEPTSALSKREVEQLFDVVKRMREKRMSFIYISHKLDEVFELADKIVVLRDGESVAELDPKQVSEHEVIRHMVGRPLSQGVAHQSFTRQVKPILEVANWGHVDPAGRRVLEGVSFSLQPGEVLGIAGLMGSGRSELLRSLLGILPGESDGQMKFNGEIAQWTDLREAMDNGMAFVPEDRKRDGLFLEHSIGFNLMISNLEKAVDGAGRLDLDKEQKVVADLIRQLGVKCQGGQQPVGLLSGGNQQKVLLAKMVAREPKVLFLDEPTRGIDVGAKEEIYGIVRSLAERGMAILLVSSELPEVIQLSDRVLVMREGRLSGSLDQGSLSQERIMGFAAGAG